MFARLAAVLALSFTAAPALAQSPPGAPAPTALQPAAVAPDAGPMFQGRFTVKVVGIGPDVILIPGLSSSRDTFAGLVAAEKGRYRFHLIQLGGFAGTPAGDNAQGVVLDPVTEAVAAYAKEKGLKKPAVVGHSLGGAVALMLAARDGDQFGRAMSVDSLPFLGVLFGGPSATPDTLRPMVEPMARGMAGADDRSWLQSGRMQASMMATDPARQAEILGWMVASDRKVVAEAFKELALLDLRPELSKITIPVTALYVHGPQYPQTADQTTALVAGLFANLKGVELVRVEPSRHFLSFDQPERFRAEVVRFLER